MDAKEKLFRKLSRQDRQLLLELITALGKGELKNISKKLKGSGFHRLRKGRFRIIFHYTKGGEIEIDSIRLRDKDTYKDA